MRPLLLLLFFCCCGRLTTSTFDGMELDFELINACADGMDKDASRLLHIGASATAATPDGETALHVAGIGGSAEVVKILVAAGADVDARVTAKKGLHMTPLAWFVYGQHEDGVGALLDAGASPNLVFIDENNTPLTVLDVAKDRLHNDALVALLESKGARLYADLPTDQLPNLLPPNFETSQDL